MQPPNGVSCTMNSTNRPIEVVRGPPTLGEIVAILAAWEIGKWAGKKVGRWAFGRPR